MEFRVLRYFLAIAREESISGAAERLHITQPTLSRQMKELEDELGQRLFERGSRKIALTVEGQLLRKRAEEIISLVEKTENEISSSAEVAGGDIFLGCAETDKMRILIRAAKKLRGACPGVRFHIFSGHGESVSERLDKGLIDFALFVGRTSLEKYNYIRLPQEEAWGVVVRRDHPLAAKHSVRAADLCGIPLVCSRQMLDNNEISGWLGCDPSELDIAATYNLVYNASLMAEEGIGAVITIESMGALNPGGTLCFRPLEPRMQAGLVLAWKKGQRFSKAAEKFMEYMRKEAAGAREGAAPEKGK